MKLQQSNIWQDADVLDYICITTNAKVKKTGESVKYEWLLKIFEFIRTRLKDKCL